MLDDKRSLAGEITGHVDTPAGRLALGCAVDPGDTELMLLIEFGREREELIEIAKALGYPIDLAGADRRQLDLGPLDQPSQTQAADGRVEEVGLLTRRADRAARIRAQQSEAAYVPPEGATPMMILSMDVVGNGAAQSDVLGARRHRQEPAMGNRHRENFFQRHPSLGCQHARRPIGTEEAVKRPHM